METALVAPEPTFTLHGNPESGWMRVWSNGTFEFSNEKNPNDSNALWTGASPKYWISQDKKLYAAEEELRAVRRELNNVRYEQYRAEEIVQKLEQEADEADDLSLSTKGAGTTVFKGQAQGIRFAIAAIKKHFGKHS
jgi:hypothetical protein